MGVDCTYNNKQNKERFGKKYGAWGCDGGWPDAYWDFSMDHGSMLEEDYPYKGKDRDCQHDEDKIAVRAGDYTYIEGDIENAKIALQNGPLSVGVSASRRCWSDYKSGILSEADNCPTSVDHLVVIVGIGTEPVEKTYYEVEPTYEYKCRMSYSGFCNKKRERIYRFPFVYCCKEKMEDPGV